MRTEIPEHRFGSDPWRLVQEVVDPAHFGTDETLFSLGNGYLGVRATPEEGRVAVAPGTFLNGFHETWPIKHAEAAYAFARTGQTILNAPDATVMKVYVDDEPLVIGESEVETFSRVLDMEAGLLRRSLVWRTPSGRRVRVESTRMVSMEQRHLSVLTLEVTVLDGDAPVVVSSQLLNRQDGQDDYHVNRPEDGELPVEALADPRKAGALEGRVLHPAHHGHDDGRLALGFVTHSSQVAVAVAAEHRVHGVADDDLDLRLGSSHDRAKAVFRFTGREGAPVRIEKFVVHHTAPEVAAGELADRCDRTLDRALEAGVEALHAEQRAWFDGFWDVADVRVQTDGADADQAGRMQQAVRFNLFALVQQSARADGLGIAAKGVSGSGYEGHYFWDTEIYVVPFLTYTLPHAARNALHFRRTMLPAARNRAAEMAQSGALFPWRTINGEEASAYYAAGTAQMHINGDIVYALMKYVLASGDIEFLRGEGADILVETARMWHDLGFFSRREGKERFEIHSVTGPDEYTTVVNNNLFTNLMAQFNLEAAYRVLRRMRVSDPDGHRMLVERLGVTRAEVDSWERCATLMKIPFDEGLGVHPQDDAFLDREVWDLTRTPPEKRPLLLNYHPLVIYRFQVLKQADVVLALFLHGDRFTSEQKRADFEYYDPITTGDSTLSAVVQSIMAAEVGYHEVASAYFAKALDTDLGDLHSNTVDGIHVASAGGVWSGLVFGFGGMRDHAVRDENLPDYGARLAFDPRLPADWTSLSFTVAWKGSRLDVVVRQEAIDLMVRDGGRAMTVWVRGKAVEVLPGETTTVPLADHGPRIDGLLGDKPHIGGLRADGSRITAGVPSSAEDRHETLDPYADWHDLAD
ncbi:glycoside hydrolase family 65 protein [Nocardioides yefusunii]|uniref:Glycoside hydrolase family 65 protein n=1 Tax=Nocardioides yefusunii TaxID=2500546 RepID=A0ABW1QYM0_9ACTN|nr:glycosyl hydrolase family 65 protein [Nocardioides yefusunii]